MDAQLVICGLPERLAKDAWWFLDEVHQAPQTSEKTATANTVAPQGGLFLTGRMSPKAIGALVVMILLADQLFWQTELGISVALYTLALAACMLALKPGGVTRKEAGLAMAFVAVCVLPVVEMLQPLSLLFCAVAIIGVLGWIATGTYPKVLQTTKMLIEVWFIGPFLLPIEAASDIRANTSRFDAKAALRATALPLVIGGLFLILFASANPLVEAGLDRVTSFHLLSSDQISRVVFWVIGACLLWPYLTASGRFTALTHKPTAIALPLTGLVNAGSVRTSLILFNVMFAVQTFSDIGVLSGGMTLPDGMSYASYAHRGAYPLLITALLSGAFAIAIRPLVAQSALLRGLMYLWLGQTLFLVLTAALRLSLYVEAYTLTYLRVAAFIWMGLIFVGIVLIIVQMAQARPTAWLMRGNGVAVAATLYACCFINFAYLITDYNMSHTAPEQLDLEYLCNLGEQVIPAMMDFGEITDNTACGRGGLPALRFDPITDWQEWGFRRWRLQRYLETYHDL
ncbi:DUF4173 domain-containing protein [Gymnodinialimonas sp. 57CJ19]|uniref:DUF4153 domain-containing protein n=1 Tax=Gymnodinialimonas sp. 57CJ19 TaxID=3138498 RepID=UPI0031343271